MSKTLLFSQQKKRSLLSVKRHFCQKFDTSVIKIYKVAKFFRKDSSVIKKDRLPFPEKIKKLPDNDFFDIKLPKNIPFRDPKCH